MLRSGASAMCSHTTQTAADKTQRCTYGTHSALKKHAPSAAWAETDGLQPFPIVESSTLADCRKQSNLSSICSETEPDTATVEQTVDSARSSEHATVSTDNESSDERNGTAAVDTTERVNVFSDGNRGSVISNADVRRTEPLADDANNIASEQQLLIQPLLIHINPAAECQNTVQTPCHTAASNAMTSAASADTLMHQDDEPIVNTSAYAECTLNSGDVDDDDASNCSDVDAAESDATAASRVADNNTAARATLHEETVQFTTATAANIDGSTDQYRIINAVDDIRQVSRSALQHRSSSMRSAVLPNQRRPSSAPGCILSKSYSRMPTVASADDAVSHDQQSLSRQASKQSSFRDAAGATENTAIRPVSAGFVRADSRMLSRGASVLQPKTDEKVDDGTADEKVHEKADDGSDTKGRKGGIFSRTSSAGKRVRFSAKPDAQTWETKLETLKQRRQQAELDKVRMALMYHVALMLFRV